MSSTQSVNQKIVDILKELKEHHLTPKQSIELLLQLRENQSEANKQIVQKALLLLLQSQHDWQNAIKYLKSWKNSKLTTQFYDKMKIRCQEEIDYNQVLSYDQKMKQIDRLVNKYWMTVSQKKQKIQYNPHKASKEVNEQQNTNSRASKPSSHRSIILNPKINSQSNNLTSKSQSFSNEVQLNKKNSGISQSSASLQNFLKNKQEENKVDSKNISGLAKNENSSSYSVGTGFRKGVDKNMNIFKLMKKQQKSKDSKISKEHQDKQKFQSPSKQLKSQVKKQQKKENVVIYQKQLDLDKNQKDKKQLQKINKQSQEEPKLKSLKKPFGLSPYKQQIKPKKFTIKGAGLGSNSLLDSAQRKNLQKFSNFQNDFSFEQSAPKFTFSSRKKEIKYDKNEQQRQLQEALKNQDNFKNPQSSSLSQIKSSSLNFNANVSSQKSIFGRSRNPTALFSNEELRYIKFDKVNSKLVNFHKIAEKRCGINIMGSFDQMLKRI